MDIQSIGSQQDSYIIGSSMYSISIHLLVNCIGSEGAKSLSKALEVNNTLTELNLGCIPSLFTL